MGKSIDNNCKFDVTDIIKNVKNEKDLINIFREYMRLLGLIGVNALSDKSKSALNEIRAYFYKDF
jgi:hypothetical protein